MHNGSGMNNVASSLVVAERKLGIDAHLANPQVQSDQWEKFLDADVHVDHTHVPDSVRRRCKKKHKLVYIAHGTPEHVFHGAVEAGTTSKHGFSDSWMLMQWGLQHSDASVTFWPRHQRIYQSLCDKNTKVHCIPLGVDKTFWKPVKSLGHYAGDPAILTAENCHYIKWPLDLFIAWPWVLPKLKGNASLHCFYLPTDMHRWFFPLLNRNGASYGSHVTAGTFDANGIRNAFVSSDFYIGLVQKGDFNRCSLEANACGATTISYEGNPFSDYWVPEGSQERLAEHLIRILNGEVEPRKKSTVPDVMVTARGMQRVYESIL